MANIVRELATFIRPFKDLDTLVPPLEIGQPAPDIYIEEKGQTKAGCIVVFLRHIGCPFCEKAFLQLRNLAVMTPRYHYIAVSHGDSTSTERWCALIGGHSNVQIINDDSRRLYASWGLPLVNWAHISSKEVFDETKRLGQEEGIVPGRVTSSGNRWQGAGAFAFMLPRDGDNSRPIVWTHVAKHAADLPDLRDGLKKLEAERKRRKIAKGDERFIRPKPRLAHSQFAPDTSSATSRSIPYTTSTSSKSIPGTIALPPLSASPSWTSLGSTDSSPTTPPDLPTPTITKSAVTTPNESKTLGRPLFRTMSSSRAQTMSTLLADTNQLIAVHPSMDHVRATLDATKPGVINSDSDGDIVMA